MLDGGHFALDTKADEIAHAGARFHEEGDELNLTQRERHFLAIAPVRQMERTMRLLFRDFPGLFCCGEKSFRHAFARCLL